MSLTTSAFARITVKAAVSSILRVAPVDRHQLAIKHIDGTCAFCDGFDIVDGGAFYEFRDYSLAKRETVQDAIPTDVFGVQYPDLQENL